MRGVPLIESYHRLIEWLDRPAVLIRLAIAFLAALAILFAQVLTLDQIPPDYTDKGVYCLQAFGHALGMEVFRSVFPWLVAVQVLGVVLIALRIVPIASVALVLVALFWSPLVIRCP
jgi:hypothetical protein